MAKSFVGFIQVIYYISIHRESTILKFIGFILLTTLQYKIA